jgi:hypothetical protein
MTGDFAITGRYHSMPLPGNWRDLLAGRLGSRPRRIGVWAELALFGALECLTDANEYPLSAGAAILVASRHGPATATREVYAQARNELPMPLLFLQTQPSQMLAVLAAHLGWSGNASFVCNPQPQELIRLAATQCGTQGVLLGWVDEDKGGTTSWLRLHPTEKDINGNRITDSDDIICALRVPAWRWVWKIKRLSKRRIIKVA